MLSSPANLSGGGTQPRVLQQFQLAVDKYIPFQELDRCAVEV